ncbi:MAG: RNA methyltransferase [Peptococcaceae bacterium]|jgi:hypothetical protein|nr:RNA methyltransferase [Peptococcaceae bacterium]MDH7525682.1 RNA methyltransferase [Peptococcaceae bacterium]
MNNRVFLGLVHYPVYNKNSEIITTSITNLDIHDIARCAITYNLARYYVIHPLPTQRKLIREITDYWQTGYGAVYNPDRKEALELVELKESIEEAKQAIKAEYGGKVYTVATDARAYPHTVGYREFRSILAGEGGNNFLLLFGTGWGMSAEVINQADYILQPIYGRGSYNHLSVRSAVAIILDRVLGENWWQ